MTRLDLGEYKVQYQGTSYKVTLPKDVVRTWKLKPGDKINVYYEDDKIIITRKKPK